MTKEELFNKYFEEEISRSWVIRNIPDGIITDRFRYFAFKRALRRLDKQ